MRAANCANCDVAISDPTVQVVHGDRTFCCANCAAAMEQGGSGSDPRTMSHDEDLRCSHCGVTIVNEATMVSRGDQGFCCSNCAAGVGVT
jgi:DNA-directed RNA polymerase subunit RPC12/RpoP